jgi:hypothetical protein
VVDDTRLHLLSASMPEIAEVNCDVRRTSSDTTTTAEEESCVFAALPVHKSNAGKRLSAMRQKRPFVSNHQRARGFI